MNEKDYQIMPELTDEEYDRLKKDIEENGCKVPVDVDEDGVVLDGNNRVAICEELGIDYETRVISDLTEEEKFFHVIRMNVVRRQLVNEQLDEVVRQAREKFPEISERRLAEMIGISRTRTSQALRKQKNDKWDEDDGWEDDEWENEEWDDEDDEWDDDDFDDDETGIGVSELKKLLGKDNKKYPGHNAGKQREVVRKEIAKDPDRSDREIARETGVSPTTVALQRKRMDDEPEETTETAGEDVEKQDSLSVSAADEMYAVLKGEAERLEHMLSSLLDKNGANAEILATDEGLEAAVGGLMEISDVARKYRELITG